MVMVNCLPPGRFLQGGKYRIIRTLGQGGFGITYLAEHVLLKSEVAVKEFFMKDCCERDDATSRVTVGTGSQRVLVEKFRGKFIREAQMMHAMAHPHIVRVTDVFEENGTAYYVMENLPGGSLADRIKKIGPMPESQAENYIRQVSDALAYIHSRNTVHLDVKPSNILLNAKGDAVLIDFGISKHYDDSGEQTSSTPVGISKGYAPLEQGRDGDVSQFKPSTDIYALGATLYHFVSGHVPPEASIVNEDGLERPEGISDRIWDVITHAMQPRRKDRPQNIAEFLRLFDAAPTPTKEAVDETEVITKKEPVKESAKEPKIDKKEDDKKKPFKSWLWIVLGVLAVAAIVLAVILGKKSPSPLPEEPLFPAVDSVETVKPQEPARQPSAAVIAVTGIKLSKTSLELQESESATLKATVTPADATDKTVTWKSFDEQIATVSKVGKVTAKKVGNATIVARCGDQEVSCKVTVKEKPAPVQQQTQASSSSRTGFDNGHEWVDLGLPSGTKWATCNVGASSPTGNGNYYAWGETSTKQDYSWSTLKYCTDEKGEHFNKYVPSDKSDYWSGSGSPDNKTRLDLSDDAARANWGGRWRIPTRTQWNELKDKCKWSWAGNGYKVTGPNGQSIFLPAAGYRGGSSSYYVGSNGYYWSSSLNTDYPVDAWRRGFNSGNYGMNYGYRCYGHSVRPVTE